MSKANCLELKEQILDKCKNQVLDKLTVLEKELKYLAHDIAEDTKSSAGDKFETSREMANIEINKLQSLVGSMNKSMTLLNTIPATNKDVIAAGSLIKTDSVSIFISISLGQIEVDSEQILVISPMAPLAQLMMGSNKGETVTFRDKNYQINNIC
jgi:hypothetical protein